MSSARSQAPAAQPVDVVVVGLGHVGLPAAAQLAVQGQQVVGVDIDLALLARLRRGRFASPEPGLADLVQQALDSGRLVVAEHPVAARVSLVAVPTPARQRRADLTALHAAVDALAPVLQAGSLLVIESTVPIGATRAVHARLDRPDVLVAHVPERALPGRLLAELRSLDRIVGGTSSDATAAGVRFYQQWVEGAVVGTTAELAEAAKLAENASRDVQLAFANELANLCEAQGLDPRAVIALANRHPRVDILRPGPGVGGHCIPVDPWFLAQGAPDQAVLIPAARAVNDARVGRVVAQVLRAADAPDARVACLGLTYKADTADLRGAPALAVANRLHRALPGRVHACDPNLARRPRGAPPMVPLARALDSDVVVLLVAHREFAGVDRRVLGGRRVVDACGLLS